MLEQQTISNIVSQFILERQSRHRSIRTVKLYKSELDYFTAWLIEKDADDITKINPQLLRLWFASLGTHRNQGGIHSNYRIIKAMLNFFEFEYEPDGWRNPIRKVKIEPNRIPPLEEISMENVQKLLDVCDTTYNPLRNRAILKTLVDTGLRATEILSLNIQDIDLVIGSIKVLHGKGSKFRIVWLGKNSLKTLKDYLKTRDAKPDEPLFLTDENDRMQFFGLRALIVRLCHKANIEEYSPHCFRRLFGLTLWRKTHDLVLIQRLLGHSAPSVTIRYLNISNTDLGTVHKENSPADMLN